MKLVYIPYVTNRINAVTNAEEPWKASLEQTFMNRPDVIALTGAIDAIRAEWDKPKHGRMPCRPKYVTELHREKQKRQKLWIAFLEQEICKALDAAATKVMKPYNDRVAAEKQSMSVPGTDIADAFERLRQAEAAQANDCLMVAALPEFFWRDINDNWKHEGAPGSPRIAGYGKPIYPEVFEQLVSGAGTVATDPTAPPATLVELTKKHANLIVFAGTAWWKKIVDAGGCTRGGSCKTDLFPVGSVKKACKAALPQCEKMFNTLPVFYQGKCISLWNKQWISSIDGLGESYDAAEKYTNRSFTLSTTQKADAAATKGSVIGLSPERALSQAPRVIIPFGNGSLTFGMDICLDYISGYDQNTKQPTDGPLSKDLLKAADAKLDPKDPRAKFAGLPDFQVLIAGGMPVRRYTPTPSGFADVSLTANIYAKKYLLRCDKFPDTKVVKIAGADTEKFADFADIWTANAFAADRKVAGQGALPEAQAPFAILEQPL